ncbi:response regulator transcription factor [Candidatus Falkowbacteria bacterium]|nr:response regulator transcription factor [Candidatus Falkowbacteria bacterium]
MRILVVEDEKEIASFIKKGFEAEHFSVDVADDGENGLWLGKTNDYDIVILDIKLPLQDGVGICRQLRLDGKKMPIIMLSVKDDVETKVQALDLGADDYLTKPFSFEELLARVRALLRREKAVRGDILRIADLVLDVKAHLVTRANKKIDLSRKEFALLEYLMRNPGTVLTRTMILEHVWDMNVDLFSNTVDVHIRYLRQKIDKGRGRKIIHTVHGYGYKAE